MQDSNKQNTNEPKESIAFRSEDIVSSKLKTRRNFFGNVEEKKSFKQSAEEFQKKFSEAKAHTAESHAKIDNPGPDTNGVIRSHVRFNVNWRIVRRIAILLIVFVGIGAAVYFNWGAIYHEFFEVSADRANEFLPNNPDRFISMYEKLIQQEESADGKARLLLTRASLLDERNVQQIRSDIYTAEELYPSLTTAKSIIWYEENYGSEAVAAEWRAQLPEREEDGKEIMLGNG